MRVAPAAPRHAFDDCRFLTILPRLPPRAADQTPFFSLR